LKCFMMKSIFCSIVFNLSDSLLNFSSVFAIWHLHVVDIYLTHKARHEPRPKAEAERRRYGELAPCVCHTSLQSTG
jgi:hypothetical protein